MRNISPLAIQRRLVTSTVGSFTFSLETIIGHILCHFQLYLLKQYATREVGYFLEDSERSKQYVEMRRVAMARGNDLGIEDYLQFAAAFLVGMMGVPALNALHSLQVRDIIRCVVCCMLIVFFSLDV